MVLLFIIIIIYGTINYLLLLYSFYNISFFNTHLSLLLFLYSPTKHTIG